MAKIIRLWRRSRPEDAFEQLLRQHLPRLYQIAYRLTGSEADAEDLLHDLVIRVHPRAGELQGMNRPDIWLGTVLYRLYVDRYRRAQLAPVPAAETRDPDEPDSDAVDDAAGPDADDPAVRAERLLDQDRLQWALDALTDEHRVVVLLHDVEGYALAELATMLELPQGTLKSRLHRARRQMRELLLHGTT